MASQMVVAPSKDTLFIRGFSSRKDVEDVRDFFEKEARSKVMIEFLKQTEMDEKLFVALRFETKNVAKDILDRFDNTEVLGDKITLTWFKDLRRARYKGYPNQRYQQGRGYYDNNNYQNNSYGRYDSRRDNRSRIDRNRTRSRRHDRSNSRSVSHSRSRSRSHERGSRERDSHRREDRREDSRSLSPERTPKHKLKSAVQTASRDKNDDSDNERSSPMKESSVSPERAYTSEPPSPGEDREYSPAPKGKNAEGKSSRNKDQEDYHEESFDDSHRYQDDKYTRQGSRTQARHSSKKTTGYEGEERARRSTVDPSPDRVSEAREQAGGAAERSESADRGRYSGDFDPSMWEAGAQGRRNAGPPFYDQPAGGDWLEPGGRWPGGKDGAPQAGGSGWSAQAMQYIQDKKEDIEKVYKNDCETFVSVVKMLINKDPMLESSLQHSLRENLKEIGQRCILELREYIERLREKEEGVISGPMGVV